MIYRDGITINGEHSYADHDLVINARSIGTPDKRSIRKTIPYMNGYYDFSLINGAASWGSRTISYTFDIVGETIALMDRKRTEILNWLCNVHDVDIYDDTIPDYHFHGSFDSVSQSEDGEKSEITFTFICYPFMIANDMTLVSAIENGNYILRNNGQAIALQGRGKAEVTIGNSVVSIDSADYEKIGIAQKGETNINIALTNVIPYPYSSSAATTVANGITYIRQDDKSIIANGTATATSFFYIQAVGAAYKPSAGTYFIKLLTESGSTSTFIGSVSVKNADENARTYFDYGEGVTINVSDSVEYVGIMIRIIQGFTANNLSFIPIMYKQTDIGFAEEVI